MHLFKYFKSRKIILKMLFMLAVVFGLCVLSRVIVGQGEVFWRLQFQSLKSKRKTVWPLESMRSVVFRQESDFDLLRNGTWGTALSDRWKRFYGELSCKDNPMRDKLKTLLSFWVEFAEKHRIGYALMWGTLLGIVRVNDLLPWDHDIDILVDYRDVLRLQKIVEKPGTFKINDGKVHIALVPNISEQHNLTMGNRTRHSCDGQIVTKTADPCSFQEPLSRVLLNWWFIDVYHFYDEGKQLVTIPEGKRFVMNKTDVFPLQNCSMMGLVSLCPKNPSRLLENWYGKGFLDKSQYKCRNGVWQDDDGERPKKDWRL